MELSYKCFPSKKVIILTFTVILSITLLTVVSIIKLKNAQDNITDKYSIIAFAFIWMIILITLRYSPYKIIVGKEAFKVCCIGKTKTFYFKQITSIKRRYGISGIRRFGSNGIFGYIGIIDGDNNIRYRTSYNHEKNMVELNYDGKLYVLSCNKPNEFIAEIRTRIEK